MGRPTSKDPKVRVSLSLRTSTVERIERRVPKDSTVGIELSKAVEEKFGVRNDGRTVAVRRAEDFGSRLKGPKR